MEFTLNYDNAAHLDAEALAEAGIGDAYERLLPKLREFVENPMRIEEDRDDDLPSYSVRCGESEFDIHGPDSPEEPGNNSWGRATVAFFSIINGQLTNASHRFYAINGGNDLFGMFLTPAEAMTARESLREKRDWPYLPADDGPWYGQYH
jgi:hypothetical protein